MLTARILSGRLAELRRLSKPIGAVFHAALWGPLPFVFERIPPQRYAVDEILYPAVLLE